MFRTVLMVTLLLIGASRAARAQDAAVIPALDLRIATEAAHHALQAPVDLKLSGPDLESAFRQITTETKIPIRVDLPTFMTHGVDLSQAAPNRLNGGSLRSAFAQLWPDVPVGPSNGFPISAHEGAIHIDRFRWSPSPRGGTIRQGRWIVHGKVVDEQNNPVPRATVRLYCWAWVMFAAVDERGEFKAVLPLNGDLVIQAWNESGQKLGWSFTGERPQANAQNVEYRPTVTVKPPRMVAVKVSGEEGPIEGARVLLLAAGFPHDAGMTSAMGAASVAVPADMEVDAALAWKPGSGLDYVASRDETALMNPARRDPLPTSTEIELRLSKSSPVRFRIVDDRDKPVANVPLSPWMLRKPDQPTGMNLTHTHGRVSQRADENGLAILDWLPGWQKQSVSFGSYPVHLSHGSRSLTVQEAAAAEQKLVLKRLVPVSGRVVDAAGKPAGNVIVIARGSILDRRTGHANGVADSEGRFTLFVPPSASCLLVAVSRDGKSISQPEERPVSDPDLPQTEVVLYLRPGIRVFGNLGRRNFEKDASKPVLRLIGDDLRTHLDVKRPDAEPAQPIRAVDAIQIEPKENGEFSVLVGPGQYEFAVTPTAPGIPFELTDQTEYEVKIPPP